MTSICPSSHMHLLNHQDIRMAISQEDEVAVEAQQDPVMIQTMRLCRLHHHLVLDHQLPRDYRCVCKSKVGEVEAEAQQVLVKVQKMRLCHLRHHLVLDHRHLQEYQCVFERKVAALGRSQGARIMLIHRHRCNQYLLLSSG